MVFRGGSPRENAFRECAPRIDPFSPGATTPWRLDAPRLVAGLPWIGAALPHGARWNPLEALHGSQGAASRLPWGISPRSALRLSVRGSPHAHAARPAPSGMPLPKGGSHVPPARSPRVSPGRFRRLSAAFPAPRPWRFLRRGGCLAPESGPGPPLARGIRGGALPESGHGSALVLPLSGGVVMVLGIPAARRPCASRPGSGCLLRPPPVSPTFGAGAALWFFSSQTLGPAALRMVGAVGLPLCVRPTFGPFGPLWGRLGLCAGASCGVFGLCAALPFLASWGRPGAVFVRPRWACPFGFAVNVRGPRLNPPCGAGPWLVLRSLASLLAVFARPRRPDYRRGAARPGGRPQRPRGGAFVASLGLAAGRRALAGVAAAGPYILPLLRPTV